MGRDKGLLPESEITWSQRAAGLLTSLELPVWISINAKQKKDYAAIFNSDQLVVDDDTLDIQGPLRGILSCHLKDLQKDLLILACDMPFMTAPVLQTLPLLQKQQPGYDAYVYRNGNEAEPLCALYTAGGLEKIAVRYRQQQLAKHSVKYALDQLLVCNISVTDHLRDHFRNINEHSSFSLGSK